MGKGPDMGDGRAHLGLQKKFILACVELIHKVMRYKTRKTDNLNLKTLTGCMEKLRLCHVLCLRNVTHSEKNGLKGRRLEEGLLISRFIPIIHMRNYVGFC